MDEIKALKEFASRSAAVTPSAVDVSERVLSTIRRRQRQRVGFSSAQGSLWTAAAASLLVAVTLGLFAQQTLAELQDPMVSLFTPLVVTLQ